MSPRPYRELALVPSIVEPAKLWPWRPLADEPCPKCRYKRGASYIAHDSDNKPFTREYTPVLKSSLRMCTGHSRFWPFRKVCLETREHFHVKCRQCGWLTLMAAADGDKE